MFWVKRNFRYADYGPYQDRLADMQLANKARYKEYIMVSVETDDPAVSTCYVGVPFEPLLQLFDGFERVSEQELPRTIDTLLLAEESSDEFQSRFSFGRSPGALR